jgi:hypothetical protein
MSISTLSIAVRMLLGIAVTMPLSQSAAQEQTLVPRELKTLGATAGTPVEHERIAERYRAEAKRFQAKEQEYEQELADYYKNPFRSQYRKVPAMGDHCRSEAAYYKKLAAKANAKAEMQERLARDVR